MVYGSTDLNLQATIDLYSGGPGSGCNPEVAHPRCGRPPGSETGAIPSFGLRQDSSLHHLHQLLKDGQWHTPTEIAALPKTSKYGVTNLQRVAKTKGYKIEYGPSGMIRMVKMELSPPAAEPASATAPAAARGANAVHALNDMFGRHGSEAAEITDHVGNWMAGHIDDRFLTSDAPDIKMVDSIMGTRTASGVTNPFDKEIQISRMGDAVTSPGIILAEKTFALAHELGHHWDMWFANGSEQHRISPLEMAFMDHRLKYTQIPLRDDLNMAELERARAQAIHEFEQTRRDVGYLPSMRRAISQISFPQRNYSLSNKMEWIADATGSYFKYKATDRDAEFKRHYPKTYSYIDRLYKGEFFKTKGRMAT